MSEHINCVVCRDTGWVGFTRTIKSTRYPWSAACLCEKGMYLSSPRTVDKNMAKRGMNLIPVLVQPIDREIYNERGGR